MGMGAFGEQLDPTGEVGVEVVPASALRDVVGIAGGEKDILHLPGVGQMDRSSPAGRTSSSTHRRSM